MLEFFIRLTKGNTKESSCPSLYSTHKQESTVQVISPLNTRHAICQGPHGGIPGCGHSGHSSSRPGTSGPRAISGTHRRLYLCKVSSRIISVMVLCIDPALPWLPFGVSIEHHHALENCDCCFHSLFPLMHTQFGPLANPAKCALEGQKCNSSKGPHCCKIENDPNDPFSIPIANVCRTEGRSQGYCVIKAVFKKD